MITLPTGLNEFMKGQNLDGLKPFALLYRNKWVEESESGESGDIGSHYELDTTPIDISALIVKPNTLSMTLDVNEVAQYNANNVTLTLSDTKNYFVEGTPNSYFPDGYQLYGSRVVLYYGTDSTNRTPLFTGVIKDLPTHKPEQYQVDLKLVSPLEMLKDIEAKGFSDKVTGETLTFIETDSDGHRVYNTTGTGVGGFDAVYADGNKLFEGVDYQISQTNVSNSPALVTIINSAYYSSTITADYYTWKTDLTVEQIVAGLVAVAGYNSTNEDIRNVVWNTAVRNDVGNIPVVMGIGYYKSGDEYKFNWLNTRDGVWQNTTAANEERIVRTNILPTNFETEFNIRLDINGGSWGGTNAFYMVGTDNSGSYLNNAIRIYLYRYTAGGLHIGVDIVNNGSETNDIWGQDFGFVSYIETAKFKIRKIGTTWYLYVAGNLVYTFTKDINVTADLMFSSSHLRWSNLNQVFRVLDNNGNQVGPEMSNPGILTGVLEKANNDSSTWGAVTATVSGGSGGAGIVAYFSDDGVNFDEGTSFDLLSVMGMSERYMRYVLGVVTPPADGFNITNNSAYYLDTVLEVGTVNLNGKSVLEALQDFALISGYEFGVDRQGVFFFRPRVSSTTPTYILDHDEIVKVDTVKKNLSDFFTKLTLTFAQVPLEFYANTGPRPTLVDKYGVINKEIDKPDIVNYDNPELAQAIGPQLLEVYSALPNMIQVTGKLNLALELGDIVSLRRNMNLITPDNYTDYSKYTDLNTYYRACKITGMNYNFAKRQITYTLRDVSNKNTEPQYEFNEYIYDYQVQFGVKE